MAQWHYARGGQQLGPVDEAAMQQMLASGALHPGDLVWCEGMPQWTAAANVPELNAHTAPQGGQAMGAMSQPAHLGYAVPPDYGPTENGKCIASMVLGITSLPFCCYIGVITGPLAIVFGMLALSGMKKHGNTQGRGMAIAGVTMGAIGLVLLVGWFIFILAMRFRA